MVREFTWQTYVRSYEGDAWGLVPASGALRYLEETAVGAARAAGYDQDFHRERNSGWIIRRMTLLAHRPARLEQPLSLTTWLSHVIRVRGYREYRITDSETGDLLYSAFTEWVYVDRTRFTPLPIPSEIAVEFDVPGAPLYKYEPPAVAPVTPETYTTPHTVAWRELDSLGHVNNANYADWLDDALREAMDLRGPTTAELKARGLHLRGEYYNLSYRRAAMPGDRLSIETTITGQEGRLVAVRQAVTCDGEEVLAAESVYGLWSNDGAPSEVEAGL